MTQNNIYTNEPEKAYNLESEIEHRKHFAQFFTPYIIAKFMGSWIMNNPACKLILDPACGLGIFTRVIIESCNKELQFKCYEKDIFIFKKAKILFQKMDCSSISMINKDYMFNDWNNKYDGIICNPPYLKFHDFNEKDDILIEFQNRLGFYLNGFTNLYTLFLLKSINQLNVGGRCAYIVPSEFLNSDYGKYVKKYIIQNQTLRYVFVFNAKENIFEDVLTTSCILLFANDENKSNVEFVNIQTLQDLEKLQTQLNCYPHMKISKSQVVEYKELDENIKWRGYYQKQNGKKYKQLVPFSQYAKVVRGIATGDNNYFTFNIEKKEKFNIPNQYLLPCITKAPQASTHFFTQPDFDHLKNTNKRIFLLNALDLENEPVRKYIELGENLEVHKKYLTSHRTPWFSIENRIPALIWVGVFNRNGLKFVRNEANIRNLTAFHCVYLRSTLFFDKIDLFFAYLLTDVSKEIFTDNQREYGDGLQKFEPNDLNNAKMVDLLSINEKNQIEIINIFKIYRESILRNKPDVSCLEELNKIFFKLFVK